MTLKEIIDAIGTVSTVIVIITAISAFVLWVRGITPALIRLGNGLAKRQIALFAKPENAESIKNLLLDSKLFKEKNIHIITKADDIGRCEQTTMYLVYYPDWQDHMDEILSKKPDKCALIVYQPYDQGRIPDDQMRKMDGKRHTAVTNFRGRLLNDIVASMITTSYEK